MKTKSIPYRASLQNSLTNWLRALPYPAWMVFGTVAIIVLVYSVAARFLAGVLPTDNSPRVIYEAISDTVLITLILYYLYSIDGELRVTLDKVRGLTRQSESEYRITRYGFLNMNFWFYLIVFIGAGSQSYSNGALLYGFSETTLRNFPLLLEWGASGGFFGGLLVFLVHLMVRISQFYGEDLKLNIYQLRDIYELPAIAAKLGIVMLLVFYINVPLNVNEEILASLSTQLFFIIFSLVPLLSLLLPYAVINRRLQDAKNNALGLVSAQIEETFSELDKRIEGKKLSGIEGLKSAIESLEIKKNYIEKIPTWPWRTGAFRLSFSAVLLPLIVFVLQQLIDQFLP